MIRTETGATCREHGGQFADDAAALAHLRDAHPELFRMLSGARTYALDADDNPTQIAGPRERHRDNRSARRRRKRHRQ